MSATFGLRLNMISSQVTTVVLWLFKYVRKLTVEFGLEETKVQRGAVVDLVTVADQVELRE